MDPAIVYVKTAAGQQEIAERKQKLAPRLRTLLIMVDGRATVAEHTEKAKALGDAHAMLTELLKLGLIAPQGAATSAAPAAAAAPRAAPAPVPAPAPAPSVERSIAAVKRFAVQQLMALLGPDGDAFAERVESAKDRAALEGELSRCRNALGGIVGVQKAERFWAGVQERMPG